jgi:hypothetical protein
VTNLKLAGAPPLAMPNHTCITKTRFNNCKCVPGHCELDAVELGSKSMCFNTAEGYNKTVTVVKLESIPVLKF